MCVVDHPGRGAIDICIVYAASDMESGHQTLAACFALRAKLATHGFVRSATETGHEGQFYERIGWQIGRMQALTRNLQHAYQNRFREMVLRTPRMR